MTAWQEIVCQRRVDGRFHLLDYLFPAVVMFEHRQRARADDDVPGLDECLTKLKPPFGMVAGSCELISLRCRLDVALFARR